MSYRRFPEKIRWLGWIWLVIAFLIGMLIYRLLFW